MQVFRCQTQLLAIDTMKKCIKCNVYKNLDQYYKNTRCLDGLEGKCKACKSVYRKVQYKNNRDKELFNNAVWRKNNPERYKQLGREYYQKNKEYHNAFMQKHYYENKAMYLAKNAKYRASKLKATPSWLTEKQLNDINTIYKACAKITERTGKAHHVDHIIPLQGVDVCGLHVPWNLAILPASMNLAKHNKHNSWDTK
jgi:hypothetical protein